MRSPANKGLVGNGNELRLHVVRSLALDHLMGSNVDLIADPFTD